MNALALARSGSDPAAQARFERRARAFVLNAALAPRIPGVWSKDVSDRLSVLPASGRVETCRVSGSTTAWLPSADGPHQRTAVRTTSGSCLLHGQIDNADALWRRLGLPGGSSSAELVDALYAHFGLEGLSWLEGPFAAVLWRSRSRRAVLLRGPLGEIPLFYQVHRQELWAASEESLLPGDGSAALEEDPASVASFFALRPVPEGRTFFASVSQVPRAHAVEVSAESLRSTTTWVPDAARLGALGRDQDWVEEFLEALSDGVRQRLDPYRSTAILLSGGLDSSSVAALAAEQARAGSAPPPHLISWVFDRHRRCDERLAIQATARRLGLSVETFSGDGLGPLSGGLGQPTDPAGPLANPYQGLLNRAYQLARGAGCRTVLTGWFADELQGGAEAWLGTLLRARRLGTLSYAALRSVLAGSSGLRALGQGLAQLLGSPRQAPSPDAPWLTTEALARLPQGRAEGRASRQRRILEGHHVSFFGLASRNAALSDVELGAPYWNRRLVELMLAMPAHLLRRGPTAKVVARLAMKPYLPGSVRHSRHRALLDDLFVSGFLVRQRKAIRELVEQGREAWQPHLRRRWIERVLERDPRRLDPASAVLLWRLVSYLRWKSPRSGQEAWS